MPSFLYYVQDPQGREIVSAHVDVQKVSDVQVRVEPGEVSLVVDDLIVETGLTAGETGPLTLYRVPSDNKLAQPVAHPVR